MNKKTKVSNFKKLASVLLAALMTISLCSPVSVFAEETSENTETVQCTKAEDCTASEHNEDCLSLSDNNSGNDETALLSESAGTITPAYTRADGFWGEGTSNSTSSFVVELYEGTTKIASSTLNNIDNIIDGDVYVTWAIPFAGSSDEYWTVEWTEGYPKYDMNPDKVVLIADNVQVAENTIQYNNPDNLNKIVAIAEGFTGGVVAYTNLTDAIGKFNGRKVNVLRDVEESIEGFNGASLTTNVAAGVTITDTDTENWIDLNDVTIGSGITLNIANVFSDGSENVIHGTLNVNETYYHGYDAKTTIKDGGKVTVGDSTILRYNQDAEAGIYIYGDNNDSTVEFDCEYYIGAYSGTFYAENATVECGYFLLKNSYDDSSYADIDMTLNNSSLTVAGTTDGQDSFIIDDQASLTLENGSSINDVNDFNVLADANLNLSIDSSSSVSATNVEIGENVPLSATKNNDGTWSFTIKLSGSGTEEDPYIISTLDELKGFRDSVNAGNNYSGKFVKLAADIDLGNEEWTPIGNSTNKFQGTFDGDNHTISNLTITGNNSNVGLFGFTTGGEIKNLTLNNASVSGRLNVGALAGTPYTSKYTNITLTGLVQVEGMAYVGGVGGKNAYADWTDITVDVEEESYVKANSIENNVAYRTYVGGVIGFIGEGGHTFKNITSNIDVTGNVADVGGITGIAHYGNNFVNVSSSANVTNTGTDSTPETGGIAGVWHNQKGYAVTFENCSFTGTVTINGTDSTKANKITGGAYNASNNTADTSGSLIINGIQVWPSETDLYYAYLNAGSECITVDMGKIAFVESVELKLYTEDGELLTTSVLNTEEIKPGYYGELTGKIVMYGRSGKTWNQEDWTAWDDKPGYEVALVVDSIEVERVLVINQQGGTAITAQEWIDFPKTQAADGDLYYAYLNAESECITVDMGDIAYKNSVELKLYTEDGELLTTSVLNTEEIKSGYYGELTGKIVMYGRSGKTWNQEDWTAWDDKPGYEVALVVDGIEVERVLVTNQQGGTAITAQEWIDFPYTMERPSDPTPTPTPTPTPSATPESSVPETSDSSNFTLWASISISALIAAIAITLLKKRELSKR